METPPEPWLRGPIAGVDPLFAPLLYAFQQAREDLAMHTAGLGVAEIWATPYGFGSVGFQIRHISRSADRLSTYLSSRQLSEGQLAALQLEHQPGATREELLAEMASSFEKVTAVVLTLHPTSLAEPREVGRKRLPTTVIGLLTHIAEHTQRHIGQAIAAAKLAKAMS